jgi:hypothetical protein
VVLDISAGLQLEVRGICHTGTFFCDNTTAQSFPLTPTDMMFAAVIALNAYSVHISRQHSSSNELFRSKRESGVGAKLVSSTSKFKTCVPTWYNLP